MATRYRKRGKRHLHRIVAEQLLGRALRPGEIVHHRDGDTENNHPDNLQVMTQAEHARIHRSGVKVKPKTVCKNGHQLTPENTLITSAGRRRCATCDRSYSAEWRRNKRRARGLKRPGAKPGSAIRRTRNPNGTFAKEPQ